MRNYFFALGWARRDTGEKQLLLVRRGRALFVARRRFVRTVSIPVDVFGLGGWGHKKLVLVVARRPRAPPGAGFGSALRQQPRKSFLKSTKPSVSLHRLVQPLCPRSGEN